MSDQSYIIGVAGGSGSGKTSFVNALKQRFQKGVTFICLDDYYLPREDQFVDDKGIRNFDRPDSIKSEELFKDLLKLKANETITKQKYTFNNSQAQSEEILIQPAPVIIIEGLFIYHYPLVNEQIDLKLYIHARDELKLIRRIQRDRIERNYPLEDVVYRYEHHVMPAYRAYIEKYKSSVDIIINNNDNFAKSLDVVVSHINDRIKGLV